MITVTDEEMINSMKFMFENFKMILEPACVAGVAALTRPIKKSTTPIKKQLLLLCGSNIDVKTWNDLVFN